jgi:hypothetical protein
MQTPVVGVIEGGELLRPTLWPNHHEAALRRLPNVALLDAPPERLDQLK